MDVYLGELEQTILWTVLRLDRKAYGAEVLREIERRADRTVTPGALYATLDRLEAKGLLSSSVGDPEPGRGGRPKRYLSVTEEGRVALQQLRHRWTRLWEGLEEALEGGDAR